MLNKKKQSLKSLGSDDEISISEKGEKNFDFGQTGGTKFVSEIKTSPKTSDKLEDLLDKDPEEAKEK